MSETHERLIAPHCWSDVISGRGVVLAVAAAISALTITMGVVATVAASAGAPDWPSQRSVAAPSPIVAEMMSKVDLERALSDIRQLSGDEPLCIDRDCGVLRNRVTGSDGLERAVDYVVEELQDEGYATDVQPWRRGLYADRNVFTTITGVVSPTEIVFFVAHVDGVASCPAERCPAADDNASGTVAGLELARSIRNAQFERTIVLMFSTGEEQNMQGVRAYIASLSPSELADIKYVVNLDMVGYDGNGDTVMELYYGDHEPSLALAQEMLDSINAYDLELDARLNNECG